MIRPDEPVAFTLVAEEINILLNALAEIPYKVSAPVIARVRQQVLAHDSTAFDPPHLNGESPALVPN